MFPSGDVGESIDGSSRYVDVEVLNDPVQMIDPPTVSLRVSPTSLPLPRVAPTPSLTLEGPNTVEGSELEDNRVDVRPEVLEIVPSIIPPLGNPAPDEVYADLQAASEEVRPRRFERTNKGVPPLRYTAASPTNLVLTHTLLMLLRCFLSVLRAPIETNYPYSHKEAMARLEAEKWKVAGDLELS